MSVKFYTKDEKNELRDLAVNIRQLSVAEIADNVYGLTLYSKKNNARYLVCYEHPSLIFDLQKNLVFYNAKTTNGMNCYDFVQFYENCSFMEAREKVNQYYMERDPRNLVLYEYSHTKNAVYKHTGISLPDRESGNFNEIKDYFTQTMAFEGNVIDTLILNQSLYMSKNMHNAVFVGYDEKNNPAFALEYGIKDTPYKHEAAGSFTSVGWKQIQDHASDIIIFDSPMNALAYLSIDTEASVIASKDITTLYNMVKYYQENSDKYEFMKDVKNITYILENSPKSDLIVNRIKETATDERFRSMKQVEPDELKRTYIQSMNANSEFQYTVSEEDYDEVEYKDIRTFIDDMDEMTGQAYDSFMQNDDFASLLDREIVPMVLDIIEENERRENLKIQDIIDAPLKWDSKTKPEGAFIGMTVADFVFSHGLHQNMKLNDFNELLAKDGYSTFPNKQYPFTNLERMISDEEFKLDVLNISNNLNNIYDETDFVYEKGIEESDVAEVVFDGICDDYELSRLVNKCEGKDQLKDFVAHCEDIQGLFVNAVEMEIQEMEI